jgi:hypothetical protein
MTGISFFTAWLLLEMQPILIYMCSPPFSSNGLCSMCLDNSIFFILFKNVYEANICLFTGISCDKFNKVYLRHILNFFNGLCSMGLPRANLRQHSSMSFIHSIICFIDIFRLWDFPSVFGNYLQEFVLLTFPAMFHVTVVLDGQECTFLASSRCGSHFFLNIFIILPLLALVIFWSP